MPWACRYLEMSLNLMTMKQIPFFALAVACAASLSFAEESVLPERVLGDPAAQVEVIEYASLSCPHCAHFHADDFPAIEERFIKTGKVRFIYRDFPLDQTALIGSMIAQCQKGERFFPVLNMLFHRQKDWIQEDDPKNAAGKILRQFGIGPDDIDACLADTPSNKARLDAILEMRLDASQRLDVNSTPTFFVDGKKVEGALNADRLAEIIER